MIGIDLQNRKPIYEQIVERFQTLIVNGILEPESQMPSVRSLAMELSINPNTIQKAYAILEQEGYIYPVKGRGNFVSGNAGLKRKKQESIFRELGELVERGKELDISCELFLERTREYYNACQKAYAKAADEKAACESADDGKNECIWKQSIREDRLRNGGL